MKGYIIKCLLEKSMQTAQELSQSSVFLYFPHIDCSVLFSGTEMAGTKHTGHRSLFYQYRKYSKHLQKLTFGLIIWPKQKFLGLRLA